MKKYNNKKPLAYIATYNKNNPELFTEIIKNLEKLKNNDKIKEILHTTIHTQMDTNIHRYVYIDTYKNYK